MQLPRKLDILAGVLAICCAAEAGATAQEADFYRGKTLVISCHTGPGGGYDSYARALSRHIGRHIPGAPNVVVLNQPGAGGLFALNYAARSAPRDGTYLSLVGQGLMVHEPTGQPGMQTSLGDFNWLGNLASSTFIAVTFPNSRIRTLADAQREEVVMPSTGASGTDSQLPAAYNALLGTKFKILPGYDGGGQMNLSAERGETEGRSAWNWTNLKAVYPADAEAGKFHVLIQTGMRREPELPDAPMLLDLVRGDAEKEPVARFLSTTVALNRTLAAPPGTPSARVEILRRAIAETIADPEFLADAAKSGSEIIPMSAEETQASVRQILATPQDVIARVKTALGASLK